MSTIQKPLVIAIAGRMGSGKDTAADILFKHFCKERKQVKRLAFATYLKQCVYYFISKHALAPSIDRNNKKTILTKFKVTHKDVEDLAINYFDISKREITDKKLDSSVTLLNNFFDNSKHPTIGLLLQTLGTDVALNIWNPFTWADKLEKELLQDIKNRKEKNQDTAVYIISDVRMPQEHDVLITLQSRDIIDLKLIFINRPKQLFSRQDGRDELHESERFDFDLTKYIKVENDKSIDTFNESLTKLFKIEKIKSKKSKNYNIACIAIVLISVVLYNLF